MPMTGKKNQDREGRPITSCLYIDVSLQDPKQVLLAALTDSSMTKKQFKQREKEVEDFLKSREACLKR